jgi:hypothetical protein
MKLLPAQILPRGNRLVGKVHETSSRRILEGHGEPIGHHTLISTRGLNGDDVELEELDGVGGPVITCADVRPELVRPDHVALLASEREAPGVVMSSLVALTFLPASPMSSRVRS